MSDDSESLGSILGGASAFHAEVKAEPAPETKAEVVEVKAPETKAQPRDDAGKFARVETKPEGEVRPEVKAEEAKPVRTPDSALAEMSRRLRMAEARARELESQQQQKPLPSILEDEDAAIRARIDQHTMPLRQANLTMSVRIAQMVHKDSWADAEAAFYEAAEANPHLVQQFREAPDPGEFVYQHGIYHREMSKYGGDVIAMRDGIRAESAAQLGEANARIKALEAEVQALKDATTEAAQVTRSLNNKASGQVTADTPTDPEDISQIVRFKG